MDKKKIALLIMLGVVSTPSTLYASGRDVVKVPSYRHCTHEKMIGKDRYETGVLTTKKSKRLNNIIVVNGKEEKLVDGLCASVLIDKLDATVLPINPNKVNTDAKKIIDNAKNVYIIGENEAIPYSFEESINKKVKVTRIGGKDRFETSKEIAKYLRNYDKAFLVNGLIGQADAMSMSSVSAKYKIPILLTKENSSIFDKKENIDYTVIGGTDVISNKLQNNFEAKRIGGKTRYETNKYVLNTYYPKSTIRYFTNGETLVDALSGASLSKNDGITFISRQKNHDLLEYIDTVQVGGLPYDVEFIVSDTNNNVGGGTIVKNNPPTKPEIEAKVTEKENAEGEYFVEINMTKESTDPDGDKVSYEYEGRSEDDYYSIGTHTVKVRAIDSKKATSDWFEISFTIEKKEEINTLMTGLDFQEAIKNMNISENVKKLVFKKGIPDNINEIDKKTDVSQAKDNRIIAYVEGDTLYVASDEKIMANEDSSYLFAGAKIDGEEVNYLNFINFTNLTFDNLDTSNVTNMKGMFLGTGSSSLLQNLDLSSFNTSQVTDMNNMFYFCSSLATLDVSGWDTSQVTDMAGMFDCNYYLIEIKGLENFNTSQVTDMNKMFLECVSLPSLNLSKWDTSQVTDMNSMFNRCSKLTNLDVSEFDTSNVTNMNKMFFKCELLQTLDLSKWDTSQVTDMKEMFYNCYDLQTLNLSKWDTSQVTDMKEMFYNCCDLQILDLSSFNTSQITDMSYMFYNCRDLQTLNLSKWDASQVTDMSWMFYDCRFLKSIDLSNLSVSNVTKMNNMFKDCKSLTSINLGSLDTSKVTDMSEMFIECNSLKEIVGIETFNTSNVTNMRDMFKNCRSLTNLDVSKWDISQITDMTNMFYYCSSLTSLDLSKWDTSQVKNMNYMLNDCLYLNGSITIMNPNITNYRNMFSDCSTVSPAKFIVNYKSDCKDIAQKIVNTKSSNSNVVLGVEK